jgi:hypothetical protein
MSACVAEALMDHRYPEQFVRNTFSDLLAEVGPDAPTLCEGWTAQDTRSIWC